MGIITAQVVENYWDDISETQLKITAVVSHLSVLSSDVTVISHFIIFMLLFVVKKFIANMAVCCLSGHKTVMMDFPTRCEYLLLPSVMLEIDWRHLDCGRQQILSWHHVSQK